MKEEIQRSRRPRRFSNFLFDKYSILFLSNCTSMENYFQLHYSPFVREKRFVYISCLIDQYETSVREKERNRFSFPFNNFPLSLSHCTFSLLRSYRNTDRSEDIKIYPGTSFHPCNRSLSLSLHFR